MEKQSYSLIYASDRSNLCWPSSCYIPNLSFLLNKYLFIKYYYNNPIFIKLIENSNTSSPLVLWERK